MGARIGVGARHPDRADRVQLVGVGQDLRLQGARRRISAETVRLDGVGHGLDEGDRPVAISNSRALAAPSR